MSSNRHFLPRVSVALPVYNGQQFLAEAIRSILAQTFTDFELIICDNASTDGTGVICREFAAADSRIRYYRNDTNIGAAPNFNRAFELARAEYFKWAAHDDICLPAFLKDCVAALDADPSVVLCTTETNWIDEHGMAIEKRDRLLNHIASVRPERRFRDLILQRHYCTDVFGLIRRSELQKTRLIGNYVNSDRVLLAELGVRGRFERVPRVHFLSRDHKSRSIRSLALRERSAWFNTAHRGRVILPYWRTLGEYLKVVFRVPLCTRTRVSCLALLFEWPLRNRRYLWADLKQACRHWYRHASPASPGNNRPAAIENARQP